MQNFESPGKFYLGKVLNPLTGKLEEKSLFYDSKNFTTHAVCIGMTGSGKTGLGIILLEEAAMNKIPAIVIDPKGDLGNLFLTFPNLSPEEFKPWIDSAEAERKGMNSDEYANYIAKTWKEGLAAWGEDIDRIKKFRNSVELAIYTPASQAGIPISILSSFAAPPKEELLDSNLFRDKVLSITSSLLGLLGMNADPIKSREHILISTIIQQAWQNGRNLDIATLIQLIQRPPFTKIGALDIDTFYPEKDRMTLSISLNNLLASPGFQAWMEGAPLDIQQLLYASSGQPKLSVISIAHLSDSERMFFVTLLLNEILTWMRRQPGTSSLRALLYMDEIFGFFPPTANPPSKLPMLTLLKQARAYGVGVVLVTQNPVDLDYKGLGNCGTWFIGKLQTDRDKARVLEGLRVASNGEVNTQALDKMITWIGNRIFIMRSIYEKDPILFQTRWTLSYLRGPLTLTQISTLMDKSQNDFREQILVSEKEEKKALLNTKPNPPPGVSEFFVKSSTSQAAVHYKPMVAGVAKLHFVDTKNKIDIWQEICLIAPVDETGKKILWEEGKSVPDLKNRWVKDCTPGSTFEELPSGLMQDKSYISFAKDFAGMLYQNQTYTLYQSINPNLISSPGQSEADFRSRLSQEMHENQDDKEKKIREKYSLKISTLRDKIQRAENRMAQKQQKKGIQIFQTLISFVATVLAGLFGRKVTKSTISQTGTTLRRASQIGKDSQDASQAEEEVQAYQQQLKVLEDQKNAEINALTLNGGMDSLKIETLSLRPRKSDIMVESIVLVWCS